MRALRVTLLLCASALAAAAQTPARSWAEMATGSELERYVRALQVAGRAPPYPVSLRGWSAAERDSVLPRGTDHPWAPRFGAAPLWRIGRLAAIRPLVQLIENTGAPYGSHDGAVWAGRGLTAAVSGGLEWRAGPLTVVLDPVAFRAQNLAFALEPVPPSARGAPFNDPVTPGSIDLPQRFGAGAYQRVDLGQSSIRLDAFGVALGLSAANEIWGPAITSPIILGDDAPGVERAFFGTSRPTNAWIGRLHGRVFVGRAGQSAWSPIDSANGRRLVAGIVGVFEPRGLPGVEVGFSRFFHRFWPDEGLTAADFLIPFEGFLKRGLAGKDDPRTSAGTPDNQLMSIFARVRLPRSGLEIYGEYGREDHSWDVRDIAGEPDHISAYTLGLMRVWAAAPAAALTALRAELTNGRVTKLTRGRGEGLLYQHSPVYQGHTQVGQLLGAPAVRGGSGTTLALDRFTAAGRVTVSFSRTGKADDAEGGLGRGATSALTLDVLRFRGAADLSARLGAIVETGANGAASRAQLHAAAGVRFPLGSRPGGAPP